MNNQTAWVLLGILAAGGVAVYVLGRDIAKSIAPTNPDNVFAQQANAIADALIRPTINDEMIDSNEVFKGRTAAEDAALADGDISFGEALFLVKNRVMGILP